MAGRIDLRLGPFNQDGSCIRASHPAEDANQRRLPGAVLSQETMNLTLLDREGNIVVRQNAWKPLRDTGDFDQGSNGVLDRSG